MTMYAYVRKILIICLIYFQNILKFIKLPEVQLGVTDEKKGFQHNYNVYVIYENNINKIYLCIFFNYLYRHNIDYI